MISLGHANPWDYTPRQASAFLFLAERRRRFELADRLSVAAVAVRGDAKEIKKQIGKLTKERPPGRDDI